MEELLVQGPETLGYETPLWTCLLHLAATTIAAIYKDRWQVELFFKALKRILKVKTFLGTLFIFRDLWAWLNAPLEGPPAARVLAEPLPMPVAW